ncbi:MAG TPA: hypothetical protein VL154_18735, partial [Acetobacteraceae bacterium]|nr:hypothetical protein [Acetobacteraceae bacterium]
ALPICSNELRYNFAFSPAELAATDALVAWPGGWLAGRKAALGNAAGLTVRSSLLPGSPIVLYRRPAAHQAEPASAPSGQ